MILKRYIINNMKYYKLTFLSSLGRNLSKNISFFNTSSGYVNSSSINNRPLSAIWSPF